MKDHGHAQAHQRWQQSRSIHVNQIGSHLFHQQPDLPRQARRSSQEAQRVHRRFAAKAEGTAVYSRSLKTQRADLAEQRAIAGHAHSRVPTAFPYGGQ